MALSRALADGDEPHFEAVVHDENFLAIGQTVLDTFGASFLFRLGLGASWRTSFLKRLSLRTILWQVLLAGRAFRCESSVFDGEFSSNFPS